MHVAIRNSLRSNKRSDEKMEYGRINQPAAGGERGRRYETAVVGVNPMNLRARVKRILCVQVARTIELGVMREGAGPLLGGKNTDQSSRAMCSEQVCITVAARARERVKTRWKHGVPWPYGHDALDAESWRATLWV